MTVSSLAAFIDRVTAEVALIRVAILAVVGVAATAAGVRRRAGEARLRKVTRVADVAQRAILEPLPVETDGYRLAANYVSASEEAASTATSTPLSDAAAVPGCSWVTFAARGSNPFSSAQ